MRAQQGVVDAAALRAALCAALSRRRGCRRRARRAAPLPRRCRRLRSGLSAAFALATIVVVGGSWLKIFSARWLPPLGGGEVPTSVGKDRVTPAISLFRALGRSAMRAAAPQTLGSGSQNLHPVADSDDTLFVQLRYQILTPANAGSYLQFIVMTHSHTHTDSLESALWAAHYDGKMFAVKKLHSKGALRHQVRRDHLPGQEQDRLVRQDHRQLFSERTPPWASRPAVVHWLRLGRRYHRLALPTPVFLTPSLVVSFLFL